MNKTILFLCVLLLIGITEANSQITTSGLAKAEDLSKSVYGLGVSAGWGSGVGLSFRAHLPSKSSLQAVFGVIKSSEKLSLSIGGEYQYDLVRSDATRFFVAGTAAYLYYGNGHNEVRGPVRMGTGIGGEFHVQGALHLTVQGLFVFFSDGRILPLPQIAAHYYFF